MAKRGGKSKRCPRLYTEESRENIEYYNHTDRPFILGEVLQEHLPANDWWISFVLPESSVEVHLKLHPGVSPSDAIQEWFILEELAKVSGPMPFNLKRVLPFWNFGLDSKIEQQPCGQLHLAGHRTVSWSFMTDAHAVWVESGCRGIRPPDLLAFLDPDNRLPFMSAPGSNHVAPEERWLYVAIDMARPLEDQFKATKATCRKLQNTALALAGQKKARPRARDTRRNVWIYTLHYSGGLRVPRIAELVFEKEDQDSAQLKVKACIRDVNAAIREAGLEPPKFGRQAKPSV